MCVCVRDREKVDVFVCGFGCPCMMRDFRVCPTKHVKSGYCRVTLSVSV